MQSFKKHRKDKVEKQDALTFARGFVASVGDKGAAIVKIQMLEKAALNGPIPDQKTVNFYRNILGHINKL